MSPKVTVLMPAYDSERHLRGAIDSVLRQTCDDFELLIVDDGSRDRTPDIAASAADRRIRLERSDKHIGLTPSLNKGLGLAKGEYIARLDSDDLCRPDRLERQAAYLDSHPEAAVVGSWLRIIDDAGRELEVRKAELTGYGHFLFSLLTGRSCLYHPAVMYRKAVVDGLGGYDDAETHAEDFELWARLARAGRGAAVIPEPLTSYRVHGGQVSQTRPKHEQAAHKDRIHTRLLESYLGEEPVEAVKRFLTPSSEPSSGATPAEMKELASALKRMLERIRESTRMSESDFRELRRRFGGLAYSKAAALAGSAHRRTSLPLAAFFLSEEAPGALLRHSAGYLASFLGLRRSARTTEP